MFNHFQKISDWYWKNEDPFWYLVILLLIVGIFFGQPTDYQILLELTKNFNSIAEIFFAIITIFGFGIALVGSLNIQYSLTKIMVRYWYLQILTLAFIFLGASYISTNIHIPYFPYRDLAVLFKNLFIFSLPALFIRTFFLMDKMYEPEELIVEVITPMILQFANESLKKLYKKSPPNNYCQLHDVYAFLPTINEDWAIVANPAFASIELFNVELQNFGKTIFRLAKSSSLKVDYLLSYLYERIDQKYYNFPFYKPYKSCRPDKVNCQSFKDFLRSYIVYTVATLTRNDKQYDVIYQQMIDYITKIMLLKEYAKRVGSLDDGIYINLFMLMRDKVNVLNFLGVALFNKNNERNEKPELVEDRYEQALKFAIFLIEDFTSKNFIKFIKNTKLSRLEEKNLLAMIQFTTLILEDILSNRKENNELNENEKIFISSFCELFVFIISSHEVMNFSTFFNEYFKLIFDKHWKFLKDFFANKVIDYPNSNLSVSHLPHGKKFWEVFKESIKSFSLKNPKDDMVTANKNFEDFKNHIPTK